MSLLSDSNIFFFKKYKKLKAFKFFFLFGGDVSEFVNALVITFEMFSFPLDSFLASLYGHVNSHLTGSTYSSMKEIAVYQIYFIEKKNAT